MGIKFMLGEKAGVMIKKIAYLALAAAIMAIGIASPAKADSFVLTGVNGQNLGGVYTSPYYATVNGVTGIPVVCDDFFHEDSIGQSWTVNVSTIYNPSTARWYQGDPNQVLYYEQGAWLFTQLFQNLNNATQAENISYAIWANFSPGTTSASGWTPGSTTVGTSAWWLAQAQSQTFTAGEFANIEILTPTTSGSASPQEFMMQTPVPEASTLVLFGTGLIGFAILAKGRRTSTKLLQQL
jgi:hypothetical protein